MRHLLIHIHGFLSANNADRVVALRNYVEDNNLDIEVVSPRLSNTPQVAFEQVEELIIKSKEQYRSIGLVGYSLGGYFATCLATRHSLKTVLVNPVVRAYEIMCEFFGECFNEHTGEKFEIGEDDIQFLVGLYLEKLPDPALFLLMLQMDDEVVDPGEAREYYRNCRMIVEKGGCHEFSGFETHVPGVINFLFPG